MDADTNTPGVIFEGDNNPKPKRYVRTLAGDIETVQKGGTPDLAPLGEEQSTAKERLIASSPLPPVGELTPNTQESSSPTSPEATQGTAPPGLPRMPLGPAPIKTYSQDFSEKVKETGATTATILAAEQDLGQQPSAAEEEPAQSKKNLMYIIAGSALVILGLGGAFFAYLQFGAVPVPIITQGVSAPIFVDERQEISGNGTALLQAIEQSVSHPLAPRTVRLLYLASSTDSVFSLLPLSAPDILRRNVNGAGSMAGIVSAGGGSASGGNTQSAFFILSVLAYRDTFAGMLSWEAAMPNNLSALFPAYPVPAVSTTTVATTTGSQTSNASSGSLTSTQGFHDEVVNNHDVRAYRDVQGRSVMLYGYWNQTTLVIARDPAAFTEILGRLATSHTPSTK
jgi:hypothetical protein